MLCVSIFSSEINIVAHNDLLGLIYLTKTSRKKASFVRQLVTYGSE